MEGLPDELLYFYTHPTRAEARANAKALRAAGLRPRIGKGCHFVYGVFKRDSWHVWEYGDAPPNASPAEVAE